MPCPATLRKTTAPHGTRMRGKMTRTLFSTAPAPNNLQVVVQTTPTDDRGVVLCVGRFDTPIAPVIAIGAGGVLWALGFLGDMTEAQVRHDLTSRWPRARFVEAPEALAPLISTLVSGVGELRIRLTGTDFQMRVWRALLDIPNGEVTSYGDLARDIGQPQASRAVGSAVGQNPVSWAVPCHRVTLKGGSIGSYHWGEGVKRVLLSHEGAVLAPLAIAKR